MSACSTAPGPAPRGAAAVPVPAVDVPPEDSMLNFDVSSLKSLMDYAVAVLYTHDTVDKCKVRVSAFPPQPEKKQPIREHSAIPLHPMFIFVSCLCAPIAD
jgi:hypothetical protein